MGESERAFLANLGTWAESVREIEASSDFDSFKAVSYMELLIEALQMRFDGIEADHQVLGNLLSLHTVCQQA